MKKIPDTQTDETQMNLTAEDYIEMAQDTTSAKKAQEYLNAALALEPDNQEAQTILAAVKKDAVAMLASLEKQIALEEAELRKQGCFKKNCIGDFWLMLETRDYMRMRSSRMDTLIMMGRLRAAAQEGEELLRLCTNDNLGIRFTLMALYVTLEDEKALQNVLSRYPDEIGPEGPLARSILAWKQGDLETSLSALREITIKGLRPFIKALIDDSLEIKYDEELWQLEQSGAYTFNSIQHLLHLNGSWFFLLPSCHVYFRWAYEALKTVRTKA